ncbi:MAG: hypothetical protein EOO85_29195 [Pedobacter sp.]|nr:MAG: hypothetical protein EOO85_29195 [Pedobacter sp.]
MKGEIRKVQITREVLICLLDLGYNALICNRPDDPVRSYRPSRKSMMELLLECFTDDSLDENEDEEIIFIKRAIDNNQPVVGICNFDDLVS